MGIQQRKQRPRNQPKYQFLIKGTCHRALVGTLWKHLIIRFVLGETSNHFSIFLPNLHWKPHPVNFISFSKSSFLRLREWEGCEFSPQKDRGLGAEPSQWKSPGWACVRPWVQISSSKRPKEMQEISRVWFLSGRGSESPGGVAVHDCRPSGSGGWHQGTYLQGQPQQVSKKTLSHD